MSGIRRGAELRTDAGVTRMEERAQQVASLFPVSEITGGSEMIQLRFDGLEDIVVLATHEAYEIRLPTIEWTHGTHGPVAVTRLWLRIEGEALDDDALRANIEEALAARRAEFATCRFCGRSMPVEHRIDDDTCHGCASKHLGVVF